MQSSTPRSLNDWLAHIETLHPAEIELGLERIRCVADKLDLLAPKAKVITVAGTNGKGSCVATLEALLCASGKRVGAYTSPHILRYNERVRIDRQMVDDASLCRAFEHIDHARGNLPLTYFEMGTLAALLVFKQHPLDYLLLEVGLGGRLDAVNIVDADVAIITPIDLDHQAFLGHDRETIAREKAGILRQGQRVICADGEPPTSLIDAIKTNARESYYIGRDFGAKSLNEQSLDGRFEGGQQLSLYGLVDDNMSAVVAKPSLPLASVLAATKAFVLLEPDNRVHNTLASIYSNLNLAGRMQRMQTVDDKGRRTEYLFDVAHNPHATAHLATSIASLISPVTRVRAIVGMMADKDIAGALSPLVDVAEQWYLPLLKGVDRAASPDVIERALLDSDVAKDKITPCNDMRDALLLASDMAVLPALESVPSSTAIDADDLILIAGSFYTVAQATQVLMGD